MDQVLYVALEVLESVGHFREFYSGGNVKLVEEVNQSHDIVLQGLDKVPVVPVSANRQLVVHSQYW